MLDFRIATFLQLCETKSYTKTAKLMEITQPSVTQHIKYLQNKYNCKLFNYEGKTLRLTPEGEYLRTQAEAMTKMSAKIVSDLQRMSDQKAELRFGCPKELGEAAIATIITDMLSADDSLRVRVETGNTAELVKQLESGQLDIVLADKLCAPSQLSTAPVGKAKFGCYVAETYALATPNIRRLITRDLLVREEGASDRTVLTQLLQKRGQSFDDFHATIVSNSPAALQDMAASDIGVLFGYVAATDRDGLTRLCISDFTDERPIVFLYRKDALNLDSYKSFFEEFRTRWADKFQEPAAE